MRDLLAKIAISICCFNTGCGVTSDDFQKTEAQKGSSHIMHILDAVIFMHILGAVIFRHILDAVNVLDAVICMHVFHPWYSCIY